MVGVLVREQDGVEPVDLGAQRLRTEVRRGVDQDVPSAVADQDGWPQAVVARIVGAADIAVASDGRHTHTGAGAEHCNAQRVAGKRHLLFLAFFHGLDVSESELGEGIFQQPLLVQ